MNFVFYFLFAQYKLKICLNLLGKWGAGCRQYSPRSCVPQLETSDRGLRGEWADPGIPGTRVVCAPVLPPLRPHPGGRLDGLDQWTPQKGEAAPGRNLACKAAEWADLEKPGLRARRRGGATVRRSCHPRPSSATFPHELALRLLVDGFHKH